MRQLREVPAAREDERELLLRAADGDARAAQELYRAHVSMVFRCAARILGTTDTDVDDVVQQTFMGALKNARTYDGRAKLSTWLVGIASRRALDAARARARRARWGSIRHRVGLGRPSSSPDARHDALSRAERALAVLNPDQRAVFVLREVEGYTFQEIAEMTGVGISTLHARLGAARKRIDAHLETEEAS